MKLKISKFVTPQVLMIVRLLLRTRQQEIFSSLQRTGRRRYPRCSDTLLHNQRQTTPSPWSKWGPCPSSGSQEGTCLQMGGPWHLLIKNMLSDTASQMVCPGQTSWGIIQSLATFH